MFIFSVVGDTHGWLVVVCWIGIQCLFDVDAGVYVTLQVRVVGSRLV